MDPVYIVGMARSPIFSVELGKNDGPNTSSVSGLSPQNLAAQVLSSVSGGLSMRTLQTIEKINPDPSKTVIFALPVEILEGIKAISQAIKPK